METCISQRRLNNNKYLQKIINLKVALALKNANISTKLGQVDGFYEKRWIYPPMASYFQNQLFFCQSVVDKF